LLLVLALGLGGCAGFSGRAAAPDERGHDGAWEETLGAVSGPAVLVHLESTAPVTLVRLDEDNEVLEACTAPCDRRLPLEGTYRIDGTTVRSTWPFQLRGSDGERVVVRVSTKLRSDYQNAKTLMAVGTVAISVALAVLVVAVVVGVSNADAQTGGGKSCSACSVAEVGGGVLGLAGMVVSTVGIVRGISNVSSVAALSVEPPASARSPTGAARQEGVWRRPEVLAGAWGRPATVSVLDLRF
jgi:hypothetical protein